MIRDKQANRNKLVKLYKRKTTKMTNELNVNAVDERKAASVLGVAVQTLRNWRHQRRGPMYVKMGRSVRYQVNDLLNIFRKRRSILS
jgi:hypothetical protein